jgi:catechol 2,3-dioxygenase-like lactoylglutathione lyase family enzyme
MRQEIATVALLVRDYDEAIAFYTRKLRFAVAEDTPLGPGKRWVVLSPPGSRGARLLLAEAKNARERAAVGRQAGGRVFLFLRTDDFWRDHRSMVRRGVRFLEEPRVEKYGTVVVFEDLYGNKWDLVMPSPARAARPRAKRP